MPNISIIIPIYNVEKYLSRCLDSICNQTLKDIEIICINDCSPDNCLNILKEYAANDSRIKIINLEENKGVSVARNRGINEAKGKYLGFVDPDDYVDLDFYEKLFIAAEKTDSEIAKGSMIIKNLDNNMITVNNKDYSRFSDGKICFYNMFTTAIYKTNFINKNDILFPEKHYSGEDFLFSIKACILSNKIQLVNNATYFYIKRNDSASQQIQNIDCLFNFIESIILVINFLNSSLLKDDDYRIIIIKYINCALFELSKAKLEDKKKMSSITLKMLNSLELEKANLKKEYNLFVKYLEKEDFENLFNIIKKHIKLQIISELRKKHLNKTTKGIINV